LAVLLAAGTGTSQASPTADEAAGGVPTVSISIKLLQLPVSASSDPRAHEYIIDHLAPGTVIHRQFQVADVGATGIQMSVYAAAASISGGTFHFAPGDTQDEMTTWVSVSRPVLRLKPHQRVTEVATIAVPPAATRGDQYGVIWAQVAAAAGPESIKLISRVGIRIYLSVGPGGAPPADFAVGIPAATRVDGRPELSIPVRNTGGLAVDIIGTLSLSGGQGGLRAGPYRASTVVTLAPGQSGTVRYTPAAGLPDGPWHALVTLQSGLIVRTGQFTVDFAGHVSAASGFPAALTAGLSAAAAVLLVTGLWLYLRRRRRRGGHGPGSQGHGARPPVTSLTG
jgi:hypothetical protein